MKYAQPDLRNIPRDNTRLEVERRVRLKSIDPDGQPDLLIIDSEEKRNKFVALVWAELRPDFGKWLREKLFECPDWFEGLPSADTILRDNRALEAEGFFTKERELPKVAQLLEKPKE